RWEVSLDGESYSAPAVAAGAVYVGSDDETLYAFDTDGRRQWTYSMPDWVRTDPLAVDGTVYAGSD
ncbi:MAG: PQQ-binding-like beta-propeller repeat protein, partial [Natronomonas sp.]